MKADPGKDKARKERNVSRRAHLRDFRQSGDGSYQYEGRILRAETEEDYSRQLRRLWYVASVPVPALVVIGTLPPEVMGDKAYLLIPFILELILAVRILWGLYRITAGRGELREYQYETAAARQPFRCGLLCAAAALSLVLGAVRCLTAAPAPAAGPTALWFLMQTAVAAAGAFLYKLHKTIRWS